ncbi:fungal-specific transcription factor domain-containing protein [Penicillium macrosclerotiorum]|uniref:fungal-specific transcription factor domain-containing protein n=1 Tax=Penicillium macrosclerotiorum TaxID=303699 RepID=UPI002546C037|nr:fungal-specific transcription factor domain-containing protein [Penicillium macrosclerotiorum]KAJ5668912.1 fungal-specific transcription factor domain-containing protein [Penicillium macrosclerotiorum]
MQGVLQFHNSENGGSFRLHQKKITKRTKSGCLSCRARRTKCDEYKPVCGGCARNHLLCSWKGSAEVSQSPESAELRMRARTRTVLSSTLLAVPSPRHALSLWPQLDGKPCEQRLFQHYVERSSRRLIVREAIDNPFLNYVLPLAQQQDGILHILFAISASHMSYDDRIPHITAISHYAIALRGIKYLITDHGRGIRESPLEIIIMLLLLCNFEVIDGNTAGAVMQHLQPLSALLASHMSLLDQVDPNCACFITEQFMFFGLVNRYLGLGPMSTGTDEPTASLFSDNALLPYRSYYHGRSSWCAYDLFELVPRVSLFATKVAQCSPRHLDPNILDNFHAIEDAILRWNIPAPHNSTKSPDIDEISAAVIQQMALLVTLQCALNGPGIPPPSIRSRIDTCISEARNTLRSLSPASTAWAILLWPLLHLGSCLVHEAEQNEYISTVLRIENKARCCTSLLDFLSRLWRRMRDGGDKFYGPYGIRELMNIERIQLSLG